MAIPLLHEYQKPIPLKLLSAGMGFLQQTIIVYIQNSSELLLSQERGLQLLSAPLFCFGPLCINDSLQPLILVHS